MFNIHKHKIILNFLIKTGVAIGSGSKKHTVRRALRDDHKGIQGIRICKTGFKRKRVTITRTCR